MDPDGLKPKGTQTIKDLEKAPITKKAHLMELQKKNPSFGGFEGVPLRKLRKIYVSPGPSMNLAKLSTMSSDGHRGCMPRAFALETLRSTQSVTTGFFATEMFDNSFFTIRCITIPNG
jgi:hypothetical protein